MQTRSGIHKLVLAPWVAVANGIIAPPWLDRIAYFLNSTKKRVTRCAPSST